MASSPRMTRDLIEEIIANVLKATNLDIEREQIVAATKERARALLVAKLPTEFVQLVAQHPREWFCWQPSVYVQSGGNYNPVAIVNDQEGYQGSRLAIDPPVPALAHRESGINAEEDLADLIAQANAWREKRAAATDSLRAFLRSCNTVAKAIERMPEIEPHVPKAATNYALVAPSNALAKLTGLGFDTSKAAA